MEISAEKNKLQERLGKTISRNDFKHFKVLKTNFGALIETILNNLHGNKIVNL